MATASSPPRSPRLHLALQSTVLVVAALYFAQPVLLPLALAVLLTFLLRPVVLWLERRRLPRVLAVAFVAASIFTAIGFAGWIVTNQIGDLVLHLDDYRDEIRAKIRSLKGSEPGVIDRVRTTVEEVSEEIDEEQQPAGGVDGSAGANRGAEPDVPRAPPNALRRDAESRTERDQGGRGMLDEVLDRVTARPGDERFDGADQRKRSADAAEPPPLPVRVVPPAPTPTDALGIVLQTLASPAATAAVVVVLVVFMLIGFEDLRNRVVRLAGEGRLSLTTKTFDDAGRRISRYLLMNALVNGGFGLLVFLGLLALGVDYAALWGFLAAVLRFVPYVGPITAAVLPVTMAVIQFPDWTLPLLAAGLFVLLELVTNNVVEPVAYGKSAGVSTVALLVLAAFWTWLWGPMGLVLSVPMTVVLAVLGRHVPQLESIGILLGDQPALEPYISFYQRLLARDADEAADLVDEQLAAAPQLEVYDRLFVPALALAERDRSRGELSEADKEFVWRAAGDLVAENSARGGEPEGESEADVPCVRLLGCPAQDAADELALAMLGDVLPAHFELQSSTSTALVSEVLQELADRRPHAVVISALGPGGAAPVRHLLKRMRQHYPQLPIVVGRWGYQGDRARMTASLKSRGATYVATTLAEGREAATRIQPLPTPAST